MTFTPERATVAQRVQIGAESLSALGTPVAAGKVIGCYDWTFGISPDVTFYRPTGRKYDQEQEENMEWVDGTLGGWVDYNGILYPLAGAMGAVSPVAHGASTTAKDWIYTPPVTGYAEPQTYTIMQGDTTTRAHKFAYGLFTQFGYKIDRKTSTVSGKILGQPLQDNITLTASPTEIALAPAPGKHFNVYLDSTSGGLGTTQLTRVLSLDYTFDSVYGPMWVLNRATTGFTAHVDLAPKSTIKIKMEADANGMAPLSYLQSGATYYLRVQAQGAQIASDGPGAINSTITHDMAIKFGKPSTFSDDSGVFAIEWECTIVEDPSWNSGQSQTITVTNLIAAL
jgi:hypothetical protein